MTATYDLTQAAGLIRLNTFGNDTTDPIFQDEELSALYAQEGSNVKRASARVLEIVAQQELFIQKVIKNLSLQTDGAKLAAEFRQLAANLRTQADNDEANALDGAFDVAEQVLDDFSYRERIWKQALRGQL